MGRAETGDFHPVISEWGGAWVVPCQVQVDWANPGQLTYDSQTFPISGLSPLGLRVLKPPLTCFHGSVTASICVTSSDAS
jgi:hypothetical protein